MGNPNLQRYVRALADYMPHVKLYLSDNRYLVNTTSQRVGAKQAGHGMTTCIGTSSTASRARIVRRRAGGDILVISVHQFPPLPVQHEMLQGMCAWGGRKHALAETCKAKPII